jgi:hypothetical protein
MSATTGPVLAIGGITIANRVLFHDKPFDWKVPIATGIAAMGFAVAERAWPQGAVGLAWLALVTVLFARLDPGVPAPVETLNNWLTK